VETISRHTSLTGWLEELLISDVFSVGGRKMSRSKSDQKTLTIEEIMRGDVEAERLSDLKFEEALALLEGVVSAVESGNLPLDQAITAYERGTMLIQRLRGLLSGAEEKLRVLT
jgi:exodeoxyribonuclease VII small subunit